MASRLNVKILHKKAVLLDLDNTLYSYDPAHHEGLRGAYLYYRRRIEKISWPVFRNAVHRARLVIHNRLKTQGASHARLLYFKTLLEMRQGRTDFVHTRALEQAYWQAYLKKMRVNSWVRSFLKFCRRHRKRVVIVTNQTAEIQLRKIRKLRIASWIDFLVTSEEAGIEKPHPKIFRLALQKAGCRASEAIVIGDDPRHDRCEFIEFIKV